MTMSLLPRRPPLTLWLERLAKSILKSSTLIGICTTSDVDSHSDDNHDEAEQTYGGKTPRISDHHFFPKKDTE